MLRNKMNRQFRKTIQETNYDDDVGGMHFIPEMQIIPEA